jgi:hypothetical protein
VAVGQALAAEDARFAIVHASFADMAPALAARGITQVDGVLLDLGVSSPQIDNPARGFSFRSMRRWTCAWTRPVARPPRNSWPRRRAPHRGGDS